jgi:xylulokinase
MALLDDKEKLVFPHTIGWQDLRYVDMLNELKKEINSKEYWEISGMNFGTYNVPVLRWLEKYSMQEWERVKRICSHQDYFLRRYGADGYYIDEGNANFLSMVNR